MRFGVSLVTPFDESGAVNWDSLARLADRAATNGAELWIASSGTAEANVLSDAEIDGIAGTVVAAAAGRVPVVAMGREPRSAKEQIAFIERMAHQRVDAVQVGPLDPGHSYLPSPDELIAFHREVLAASSLPCHVASHMSVGYEVPARVLIELVDDERVTGLMLTHLTHFAYVQRVIAAVSGTPVMLGSPMQALEGIACGAAGVVSSMDANAAPQLYAQLSTAVASGDLSAALPCAATILALFERILGAGGLVVLKSVLDLLGLSAGPPRPPRLPADERVRAAAEAIVVEFSLA